MLQSLLSEQLCFTGYFHFCEDGNNQEEKSGQNDIISDNGIQREESMAFSVVISSLEH
jgi:hypothetical protein